MRNKALWLNVFMWLVLTNQSAFFRVVQQWYLLIKSATDDADTSKNIHQIKAAHNMLFLNDNISLCDVSTYQHSLKLLFNIVTWIQNSLMLIQNIVTSTGNIRVTSIPMLSIHQCILVCPRRIGNSNIVMSKHNSATLIYRKVTSTSRTSASKLQQKVEINIRMIFFRNSTSVSIFCFPQSFSI